MSQARPLYETKTLITLDEFRKLNRALSNRRVMTLVLVLAEIAMAVLLILSIVHHDRTSIQLYVIMLVLIPIIAYFVPRYMEKRMYAANNTLHNSMSRTKFYKNHFEHTNQVATSTRTYAQLMRIIETPTNFYLMVSKVQVAIIVKKNCEPKLIAFLQGVREDLAAGRLREEDEPEKDIEK